LNYYEFIEVSRKEGFAIVTLNRPDVLNAINNAMRREIVSALDELLEEDAVRSVIFTGKGRAFCSGVDLKEDKGIKDRVPLDARRRFKLGGTEPFNSIAQYQKPTIAAINGFAVGGGCELALACDIRLAAEGAKLGQPEVKRGIIPGAGGTQRLPRIVGIPRAKELILTGELIEAKEAERIGLVNHVYQQEKLLEEAENIASKIAKNAPAAVMLAKSAIDRGMDSNLNTGLSYEKEVSTITHYTEDKEEGVRAFIEKREPKFTGR
jgi:enoyl-CoA hydratase